MERFHISDIINLLSIPHPQDGRSSYYIQCPCCDDSPSKKHLNVNLKKDVFRCPRCGISGGIFDLYSLFTGVPRDKARKAIINQIGKLKYTPTKKEKVSQNTVNEYPITDVQIRHDTYTSLLSMLSLAPDHKDNLLNRGLSETEIIRLEYKTTPIAGTTAIAKQLQQQGLYLSGVPGFYRNDSSSWSFIYEKRGILIPVRDIYGRIQGLQIRRDNVEKRKFRWVSSADKKDGCRAEGWTHLAGNIQSQIILTEGSMKADVIHSLTGLTVLAVPGVNALTQLQSTLELLKQKGVTTIKTAFDMDLITNPHVQNGYNKLLSLLNQMDFKYGTYLWDSRYKGLDDYIWLCQMQQNDKGTAR